MARPRKVIPPIASDPVPVSRSVAPISEIERKVQEIESFSGMGRADLKHYIEWVALSTPLLFTNMKSLGRIPEAMAYEEFLEVFKEITR